MISSKEEGFQHITRSNEISDTEHTDSFQSINNLDEINSAYASETFVFVDPYLVQKIQYFTHKL